MVRVRAKGRQFQSNRSHSFFSSNDDSYYLTESSGYRFRSLSGFTSADGIRLPDVLHDLYGKTLLFVTHRPPVLLFVKLLKQKKRRFVLNIFQICIPAALVRLLL